MSDVVLCSGGLDSTIVAWYEKVYQKKDIMLAFVNYGQYNHAEEYDAAWDVSRILQVPLCVINAQSIYRGVESQILQGADDYTVEGSELPGRNLTLLTLAATNVKEATIYIGIHKTAADYRDCTPTFVSKADDLLSYMTAGKVHVEAPFKDMSKLEMVEEAFKNGFSPALWDASMSCYNGDNCGKCPACKQRQMIVNAIDKKLFLI